MIPLGLLAAADRGRGAPTPPAVERTPMQMVFSAISETIMHLPEPSNAAVLDFDNQFASVAGLTVTGTPFGSGVGSIGASDGVLTVSGSQNTAVIQSDTPLDFPDCFVAVDILAKGTVGGTDILEVGICNTSDNFVTASFDRGDNRAWIQLTKIGQPQINIGYGLNPMPAAPFRLGLGVMGDEASMWVDSGSGWTRIIFGSIASRFNFNSASALSGWRACLVFASGSPTTWKFSRLKMSRFGTVGVRDHTIFTNPDGTPYVDDGKGYLCITDSFGSGSPVTKFRQGIYAIDLTDFSIELCGSVYIDRSSIYEFDCASHIIVNGDGTYDLFTSTWGDWFDGRVRVQHKTVNADLRSGSHIIGGMTTADLPGAPFSDSGIYDPMAWTVGGEWFITYTIIDHLPSGGSNYWPLLAKAPSLSGPWTLVAEDSAGATGYEGTKVVKAAGDYWITAAASAVNRVYDDSLAYVGNLDAAFSGGSQTKPHAMMFPHGDYVWLVTFDNYQFSGQYSWGKHIVQRSPRYT